MITMTKDGISGASLEELGYIDKRSIIGRIVLPITRWLRAINAEKYIDRNTGPNQRLLDIGCGDGYFLKRSNCEERIGLDKRLGDEITDALDFQDNYFDYVTMLAVIEHIKDPLTLMKEVHRVLKPGGRFIMTTPKEAAEFLIHLYVRDIEEEHEIYFDHDSMKVMVEGLFEVTDYRTFILGLNQVFCLVRPRT
jgi:SAM-dependent methyltransferase